MVSRFGLLCSLCDTNFIARITIGHEPVQKMEFECPECKGDLSITLDLSSPPTVKNSSMHNCEYARITQEFNEGHVINLAPFAIPEHLSVGELQFPSLHFMQQVWEQKGDEIVHYLSKENKKNIEINAENFKDFDINSFIKKLRSPEENWHISKNSNIAENWGIIKNAFRFYKNNNHAVLEKQLNKYWSGFLCANQDDDFFESSFEDMLFDFICVNFLPPDIAEKIMDTINYIKNNIRIMSDQYRLMLSDYDTHWKSDRFEKYIEIISEYFSHYDEYSQIYLYDKSEIKVPSEYIITTNNFKNIKNYYGNAFEELGSLMDFVAMLQNISAGRKYDEFQSEKMNIQYYRKDLQKSGRPNCFKENSNLNWIADEFDNNLRNSTHHRWVKNGTKKHHIEIKKLGQQSSFLTYNDYLKKCNNITYQTMALMIIEVILLRSHRLSIYAPNNFQLIVEGGFVV